jgi:hypothetical protein
MLLGAALGFGVPLGYGLATLRTDIFVYPTTRFIAILVAFAAVLGATAWAGLRPLQRPALCSACSSALSIAGVGVVVIAAVIPAAHASHPESLAGVGDDFWARATACFVAGLALAVPVGLAVRFLSRARTSWLGAPMMAPLSGVLAANLALHLHCPLVAPRHLLAGHAALVLPFVLVVVLIALGWRRRASALLSAPSSGGRVSR